MGQTAHVVFEAGKLVVDQKHFVLKCACEMFSPDLCKGSFFATVARQYTCYTHEELGSSFIGLHAYFQNTGFKNMWSKERREKLQNQSQIKFLYKILKFPEGNGSTFMK